MTFSPLDSTLFSRLFGDETLALIFSDAHFVEQMLAVEAALALVQSEMGLIPESAAFEIGRICQSINIDLNQLSVDTEKPGMPIVGLLKQVKEKLSAETSPWLHWGATTQDIIDTALILQLEQALNYFELKLDDICTSLAALARKHRKTIMPGRTHSQQALPTTFGLKVATWLAPLVRHQQRLEQLRPRMLVVQFGGAAGTGAALGDAGLAVGGRLANALGLNDQLMPWHVQRDGLVEAAGWLSMVSGTLAKMAQDVILLAQSEVGEVRESADFLRGGSSTMPQKSNPIVSELIIASARTNASLLANMHQAQIHEHERATHGWQMEWLTLPQMFGLTATALTKGQFLSKNLVVNRDKMKDNISLSRGLMLAEAASFALSELMPRGEAKLLIGQAVKQTLDGEKSLIEVLQEMTQAPVDWGNLAEEGNYLGVSDQIIDRVIVSAEKQFKKTRQRQKR